MAYWLFKSEPEAWSWDAQWRKRPGAEPWSGVRNHQAANNMKAMRPGDRGFFYHSGSERRIMGVVEVAGDYRSDPTDQSGRFGLVDVTAVTALATPVTLAAIREHPKLKDMVLVKNSRLSVQPVTSAEWKIICAMGGIA